MKKILITLALTACLAIPCLASPFNFDINLKAGLNIDTHKINNDIPVNIGAEIGKNFGGNIISISADYFVNEKKNAPCFINYKREANKDLTAGIGLGKFFDSSKSLAAQGFIQAKIDQNWFAEFKAIKRLEPFSRSAYVLCSLGYKF